MTKIAMFTGSFDPITNGHMDIIVRASKLFDELYIGLFYNKNKQDFWDVATRKRILDEVVADFPNVKVITAHDSLAVDVARDLGVTYLVRGLRNATDFDYEANMDYFNKGLAPELETVYLIASHEVTPVSSSRVRELIYFEGTLAPMFRKQLLRKWRPSVANKTKSKALLEKMWRIKWWLLSIFTVLFLLFALFFPLNNYYVELPGGAFDTKEVLTVNKKADDSKGSYNFVAVAQTKATLALMLYAQFNDFAKLQTAEEATGNYSDEDFMRINQFYMETSQNQAVYQGLTLAGKEVSLEYMVSMCFRLLMILASRVSSILLIR